MDVDLSEEQAFFAQTTRKFLAAQMPSAAVRAYVGHDPGYWRAGCELGWTSMLLPDSGGGVRELALVAEEIGRAVGPGPLLPCNVVAHALVVGGTEAQRDEWLPRLSSGEAIGAWAANPARVEAASDADVFVVSTPDAPRLVRASDVTVTPLESLDLTRRFAAVSVPEGAGEPLNVTTDSLLRLALTLQAAETCGVIDRVFAMTLEYLDDRYSFGRPLSSYQALKHRVADNKMHLEACHAITTAAVNAVADDAPDASELAFATKSFIGAIATDLVQDCVQLHGGIGVTWEHDLHLYLRRATVNRVMYLTPNEARAAIATMILGAA